MAIREVKRENGETWFFVKIEFDGQYYSSKVFPTRTAAKIYRDDQFKQIAQGVLHPAKRRRTDEARDAALEAPFRDAVEAFLETPPHDYRSKAAVNNFKRLARIFGDKPMREFAGESGKALLRDHVSTMQATTCKKTKRKYAKATVRKDFYAILKVLQWYKAQKLRGVAFELPRFERGDGFKVPPSHSNKRKRTTRDDEWAAFQRTCIEEGAFDMLDLCRLGRDIGLRLSEGVLLDASEVHLNGDPTTDPRPHICLPPERHKTGWKTGESRILALSDDAIEILKSRLEKMTSSRFFSAWHNSGAAGKEFAKLRKKAGIGSAGLENLIFGDFKRDFIKHAKSAGVSTLDIAHQVGDATLLDGESDPVSREIQRQLGHTTPQMTLAYSSLDVANVGALLSKSVPKRAVDRTVPGPDLGTQMEEIIQQRARAIAEQMLRDALGVLGRSQGAG